MADPLGNFEILVMLAIEQQGGTAYGVTIRREIQERTGRFISIGALYATLYRLDQKGYVTGRTGEPTPERGGKARRYYTVSALGKAALNETTFNLLRMMDGLRLDRLAKEYA